MTQSAAFYSLALGQIRQITIYDPTTEKLRDPLVGEGVISLVSAGVNQFRQQGHPFPEQAYVTAQTGIPLISGQYIIVNNGVVTDIHYGVDPVMGDLDNLNKQIGKQSTVVQSNTPVALGWSYNGVTFTDPTPIIVKTAQVGVGT